MKLDDLKKLCDGATPGPWRSVGRTIYDEDGSEVFTVEADDNKLDEDDAAFIAAFNPETARKLIAVAEAAKRNAGFWTIERTGLPEELAFSVLDPAHRFPDSLSVVEALAALESKWR